jgi:hypothetical protein
MGQLPDGMDPRQASELQVICILKNLAVYKTFFENESFPKTLCACAVMYNLACYNASNNFYQGKKVQAPAFSLHG